MSDNPSASENPFASPSEAAQIQEPQDPQAPLELKEVSFLNALGRWSLICVISAAPSFFLGLAITGATPATVMAMLFGVAVYIVAYAVFDMTPTWRHWMSRVPTRRAIMTAFGIRIGISIVFPVAMANDMFMGVISLRVVQMLFVATADAANVVNYSSANLSPIATFFTTMLEGILLNAEILLVALVCVGIFTAMEKRQKPSTEFVSS